MTLRYAEKKVGYADIELIEYVPEEPEAKAQKKNPTVRVREVVQATAAETAAAAAVAAANYDAAAAATIPSPDDAVAGTTVPMIPLGLQGQDRVPKDFGEMNALEALGVQVPHHVEARWRIIDPEMKVEKLFGLERTANKTLSGWQLNFLSSYCGTTAYTEVPVKTKNRELSKMGLVEQS